VKSICCGYQIKASYGLDPGSGMMVEGAFKRPSNVKLLKILQECEIG
jgi:hypothetical protein